MPGKVDEVKWNRAKAIVRGQKGGVKDKYALVNHIYQKMGGTFHSTKKSLGETNMKSQYNKIMNDHRLTHQDLVKSMLAEITGESTLQKVNTSRLITRAKKLGTKALKHMKTHKGKYIAGGAAAAGVGAVTALKHKKTNKLDSINDIAKGIIGRGLMTATRAVRRVGSGIENVAGQAYARRVAQTGISKPKGLINRGVSAVGGAMRRATPRQVAIGAGAAGVAGAGAYALHRRNQNRRMQQG